eukprot:TRINITY_DN3195_c0_g1_i5.p1 TRINITY_DN3195_c0_g1~~TRINITY_DN3195_c0_g1_i5.p1  ORF type:complete len:184 (-),score=26.41 TRINITY_DN3195_c0_g1_i5:35-586(-)
MAKFTPDQSAFLLGLSNSLEDFASSSADIEGAKLSSYCSTRAKSKFTSSVLPKISLHSYLQRIFTVGRLSQEAITIASIYIRRFWRLKKYRVTSLEMHRLVAASCTVAAKFLQDEHYYNSFYAKVVGLKLHELNRLEKELLTEIDYELFVTQEEYEEHKNLCLAKNSIEKILTRDNNREEKLK